MAATIAGVSLQIDGGADLNDKINPRLLDLTLTEKREAEADELSITLHNHDGKLQVPEPGKALLLQLGWTSGDNVTVGLVDKGRFIVDEVGEEGPPDKVTIRARSADFTQDYRKRRTKSWRNTTLGAILDEIAGRNGRSARVDGALAAKHIDAIEQEGKSDMAFVRDLGRRFDAVATWKGGFLLFAPIGKSATAGGAPLPSHTLTKQQGWTWRFTRAERESYDGAEASWHDQDAGKRKTVKVGGDKKRRLKRVYASEAEAKQAAEAATSRAKRQPFKFEYDLAVADPALGPDQKVTLKGWSSTIDAIKWLVESVETTFTAEAGLQQKLSLESA